MKINVKTAESDRKAMAIVLGAYTYFQGVALPNHGEIHCITPDGKISSNVAALKDGESFHQWCKVRARGGTIIYEGDTLELTF